MKVKVHWIVDGIAELEMESLEAAEGYVDEILRDIVNNNEVLVNKLGARALQGKAFLPGSEDDINDENDK